MPTRSSQHDEDGEPIRVIAVTERPEKRVITDDDAWQVPTFKLTKLEEPQVVSLPPETSMYVPVVAQHIVAGPSRSQLQEIIAQATQAAAQAAETARREAEEAENARHATEVAKAKAKERFKKKKTPKSDPGTRLLKLVGEVVVKYMSRYRDLISHDTFKKHAKEVRIPHASFGPSFTHSSPQLTHLITEKEKRSSNFKEGTVDSLSDEKRKKMKKYIEEYIHSEYPWNFSLVILYKIFTPRAP